MGNTDAPAHVSPKMVADAGMYTDDVRTFGHLPGVSVHNVRSMSPGEVQGVMERPGTIIGGFCNSGACGAR